MKRPRIPRAFLWLALLFLVGWALQEVPFRQIGATLRTLRLSELVFLLVVNIMIFLLFSSRWWLILRAQGHSTAYISLAGYRLAAFGISYFTPGTQFGGEPLQIHLLEKKHHVPSPAAFAAVSLDKLFELLANFTFLLLGILLILEGGLLPAFGGPAAITAGSILLGVPLVYLASLWWGATPLTQAAQFLQRTCASCLRRFPGLERLPAPLADAERQISSLLRQNPLMVLCLVCLSAVIWLLLLGEYWLTLRFLGAQVNLLQATMALTAARLAFLTPLPGGLGALEASQMLALQALGFDPALGISVSLLIRGRDILFGLLGLWLGAILTRRPAPAHSLPYQATQ
jgi:hypothetical protein